METNLQPSDFYIAKKSELQNIFAELRVKIERTEKSTAADIQNFVDFYTKCKKDFDKKTEAGQADKKIITYSSSKIRNSIYKEYTKLIKEINSRQDSDGEVDF